MKTEDPHWMPGSASERFIDAALGEHARLGRDGADEELVMRILQETVHRRHAPRQAPTTRRSFVIAGLAAAAVVSLGLLVLSSLRVEGLGERRSDELSFVVQVEEVEGNKVPRRVATTVWARTDPALASLPASAVRLEDLRITADHGTDSAEGVFYEGDVLVELAAFRIEAASVRLGAPEGDGKGQAPLLADRVRVVRETPSCVAEADRLSFDPATGRLVLTGVTRLETEKGLLAHFDPGDRLVLSGTGFTVEEAR